MVFFVHPKDREINYSVNDYCIHDEITVFILQIFLLWVKELKEDEQDFIPIDSIFYCRMWQR